MPSALVAAGLLPLADRPYAETLSAKHHFVSEALRRRGLPAVVAPVVASPREWGARARVKMRGGPGGRLGFHRPGSHEFVEVPLERLVRPELVGAVDALQGRARGEVELRSDGTRVVVAADSRLDGPAHLAVAGRKVRGDPTLRIDGLRVSAGSFYQVNLELNRILVARVDDLLRELAPAGVLDLYGGVGNLSIGAARRGTPVVVVEASREAAADARANFAGTTGRAEVGNADRVRAGEHLADVVLLDPPRAGAPGVLVELALARPRAILYVSCDPVSLARDLASVSGYELAWVEPYDMFPYAEHVECLAMLVRGGARRV